jgi:hypothetical protein
MTDWTDIRAAWENARSFVTRSVTGTPADRMVFIHVPKCGGRSIDKGLRRAYRALPVRQRGRIVQLKEKATSNASDDTDWSVWQLREGLLEYYLAHDDVQYLSGHFQIDRATVERRADEWRFVTVLRNPVDRWLSHYFFNRYKPGDHYGIDQDLEQFLNTDRAAAYGRTFVDYFSEDGPDEAKATLEQFDVVGFLDDLNDFRDRVVSYLGERPEILHHNSNPVAKRKRKELVTPAIRDEVRELCGPDLDVYEWARERF